MFLVTKSTQRSSTPHVPYDNQRSYTVNSTKTDSAAYVDWCPVPQQSLHASQQTAENQILW